MTYDRTLQDRRAPHSLSLSDLEQLWGDFGQHAIADEVARERYLASGCPLPPPPPPPAAEQTWHQPPCA